MGTKADRYTLTVLPYFVRASASVSPTVPMGGWPKTTVGMFS